MSNHEAKHHDEGHSHYLPSSLMEATALSLSLAARILKLDIVELWSGGADGSKQCIYVYVNEEFKKQFPNINTGYFPKHKKKHLISPTVGIFVRCSRTAHFNFSYVINLLVVQACGR